MRIGELCRKHGLKNVIELKKFSGVSQQTLNNWHHNPKKEKLLEIVLLGASFKKHYSLKAFQRFLRTNKRR